MGLDRAPIEFRKLVFLVPPNQSYQKFQPHCKRKLHSSSIHVVLIFEVVINTEWGALGNTGSLDFVRTRWDHAVDAVSKNFGKQVF